MYIHLNLVGILSILILSVTSKRGLGWFLLNGKNLLSKDDESYLPNPGPRHCYARSQPGYIVNRKLETESTGSF